MCQIHWVWAHTLQMAQLTAEHNISMQLGKAVPYGPSLSQGALVTLEIRHKGLKGLRGSLKETCIRKVAF